MFSDDPDLSRCLEAGVVPASAMDAKNVGYLTASNGILRGALRMPSGSNKAGCSGPSNDLTSVGLVIPFDFCHVTAPACANVFITAKREINH
jgi:hypothetical protein